METFINKEQICIRSGKKPELLAFLQEKVEDVDRDDLAALLTAYLELEEVDIEGNRIHPYDEGIYEGKHWEALAPFLDGFVEWSGSCYGEESLFRDIFEDGLYYSITPTVQWENESIKVPHLKKYLVYLDDGHDAFRVPVPAANLEAAKEYVNGNGEIVAIKDVTGEYPIGLENVREALNTHFGETEMALILRTLEITGVAE